MPSGGGATPQDEPVKPTEREPGEQQEDPDLPDLPADLAVALVPDSGDEAAEALALVGVFDQPTALSEYNLMMSVVAASRM